MTEKAFLFVRNFKRIDRQGEFFDRWTILQFTMKKTSSIAYMKPVGTWINRYGVPRHHEIFVSSIYVVENGYSAIALLY